MIEFWRGLVDAKSRIFRSELQIDVECKRAFPGLILMSAVIGNSPVSDADFCGHKSRFYARISVINRYVEAKWLNGNL